MVACLKPVACLNLESTRVSRLTLNLSVLNDYHELDRILESTNLDEYEFIDLPMEQHDDLLQEHLGVGIAPTLDTESALGMSPREGS